MIRAQWTRMPQSKDWTRSARHFDGEGRAGTAQRALRPKNAPRAGWCAPCQAGRSRLPRDESPRRHAGRPRRRHRRRVSSLARPISRAAMKGGGVRRRWTQKGKKHRTRQRSRTRRQHRRRRGQRSSRTWRLLALGQGIARVLGLLHPMRRKSVVTTLGAVRGAPQAGAPPPIWPGGDAASVEQSGGSAPLAARVG